MHYNGLWFHVPFLLGVNAEEICTWMVQMVRGVCCGKHLVEGFTYFFKSEIYFDS